MLSMSIAGGTHTARLIANSGGFLYVGSPLKGGSVNTTRATNRRTSSRIAHKDDSGREQSAQIIGFALRWYRHGGGSDEAIREQLGLESTRYFTELLWQLTIDPPAPIRPTVIDSVRSVARRRLWLDSLQRT